MKLTQDIKTNDDPRFYQQLGQLISSTGCTGFAERMLQLVDTLVPIHGLELSEWTLDGRQAGISRITPLGSVGPQQHAHAIDTLCHPLLHSIRQMEDPLLIQIKGSASKLHPQSGARQCNLVSSSGDRRWVIGFHRQQSLQAFSLSELSLLKSLSDPLLPLVEHHAQLLILPSSCAEPDSGPLLQAFSVRLAQDAIQLSSREQEVCLGLLTGETVPEMAQKLNVKISSVETYLKRAAAKLGVSGRHGLARWMAED